MITNNGPLYFITYLLLVIIFQINSETLQALLFYSDHYMIYGNMTLFKYEIEFI